MYNNSFVSVRTLVRQSLNSAKYRPYWIKSVVVAAWNQLFPHNKTQLKKLFIKNKVIYIQLYSLIFSYSLRNCKMELLEKLKKEIKNLGEAENLIEDIIFL